jgi:hypothetical protein
LKYKSLLITAKPKGADDDMAMTESIFTVNDESTHEDKVHKSRQKSVKPDKSKKASETKEQSNRGDQATVAEADAARVNSSIILLNQEFIFQLQLVMDAFTSMPLFVHVVQPWLNEFYARSVLVFRPTLARTLPPELVCGQYN